MIVQAVYAVDRDTGDVHVASQAGDVLLDQFVPGPADPLVAVYTRPTDPRAPGWLTAAEIARRHARHHHGTAVEIVALPGFIRAARLGPALHVDSDPTPPHGIPRPTSSTTTRKKAQ